VLVINHGLYVMDYTQAQVIVIYVCQQSLLYMRHLYISFPFLFLINIYYYDE
jgi:hypothetical protein